VRIRGNEPALRGNHFDCGDAQGGFSPLIRVPRDAAAQQIAAGFDLRAMTDGKRQLMRLQLAHQIPIGDEWLDCGRMRNGIDFHFVKL